MGKTKVLKYTNLHLFYKSPNMCQKLIQKARHRFDLPKLESGSASHKKRQEITKQLKVGNNLRYRWSKGKSGMKNCSGRRSSCGNISLSASRTSKSQLLEMLVVEQKFDPHHRV